MKSAKRTVGEEGPASGRSARPRVRKTLCSVQGVLILAAQVNTIDKYWPGVLSFFQVYSYNGKKTVFAVLAEIRNLSSSDETMRGPRAGYFPWSFPTMRINTDLS